MKIITEQAQPVNAFRKTVPPNVVAALGKALEKLPADRFESAKAFSDALGSAAFTTRLLEALKRAPELRYLHRPANLEDVFLRLTGRDLRD